MHVVPHEHGEVVVDDQIDRGYVQASATYISCQQQLCAATSEPAFAYMSIKLTYAQEHVEVKIEEPSEKLADPQLQQADVAVGMQQRCNGA